MNLEENILPQPFDYKSLVELANSVREANTPIQKIKAYAERHDMKPADPLLLTFEKTQVSARRDETYTVHVERVINTTKEKATTPDFAKRIAALEREGFIMAAPYHPSPKYAQTQGWSMADEKMVDSQLSIKSFIRNSGVQPEDSLTLRFSKGEETKEQIATAGRALSAEFTRNLSCMAKEGYTFAGVERTEQKEEQVKAQGYGQVAQMSQSL